MARRRSERGASSFFFAAATLRVVVLGSLVTRPTRGAPVSSSASGTAYSYSLTTFDPSGRLRQLEFAAKAVERSLPAAAVVCDDSDSDSSGAIVVVSWARAPAGLAPGGRRSALQLRRVTDSIVAASAGLAADFQALCRRCRVVAVEHARLEGSPISVAELADEVCALMQEHTQVAGLRPFGAAVLLAGRDDTGLRLFAVQPSGWGAPFVATAVGVDADALRDDLCALVSSSSESKASDDDSVKSSSSTRRPSRPGPSVAAAIDFFDRRDVTAALRDRQRGPSRGGSARNGVAEGGVRAGLAVVPGDPMRPVRLYADIAEYRREHQQQEREGEEEESARTGASADDESAAVHDDDESS